ncbi:MAG: hypothetical protein HY749_01700 [Gammaproteobacteria bacterium]|nr:hypothetical protein [Gammaproteobacteria bacterium]
MTPDPLNRPRPSRVRPLGAAALVVIAFPAAAASPYFDAAIDYVHDTNVGHGWRQDVLEDDVLGARIAANLPLQTGARSGLLLSGGAALRGYTDWDDLSEGRLDARAVWRVQPGTGYDALWYEANVGAALLGHTGSALRDGGTLTTGVDAGRRLTDRIELRAGYRYTVRRAFDAAVFDTASHRLGTHGEWRFAPRFTAYGGFAWQTGGLVVSSRRTALIDAVGEADAPDPALSTAAVARRAYRLDADTLNGELGVNYALGARWALDLALRYFHSAAARGLWYEGVQLDAGVLFRF